MRILFVMILLVTFTACTTQAYPTNPRSSYWTANGAMAARTMQQSWSASLQWRQYGKNYVISLFAPLGTHSAILYGSPDYVRLETSDGKRLSASTAEELLVKQTGWNLPVSNLYYWIRGLPVPGIPAKQLFDRSYQLTYLEQCGWRIKFEDYQNEHPKKIYLFSPELNIKIVINSWQF